MGVRLVSGFSLPLSPKSRRQGRCHQPASEREGLPALHLLPRRGEETWTSQRALLISLPTWLGCPFLSTWQCSFSGRTMPSPLMGTVGGRETTTAYLGEKGAGGKQGPGSFGEGAMTFRSSFKRGPEHSSQAGCPRSCLCREELGREKGFSRCIIYRLAAWYISAAGIQPKVGQQSQGTWARTEPASTAGEKGWLTGNQWFCIHHLGYTDICK